MFFRFRKKKKVELTEEQKKWNLLWEKYADGSLEKDYFVLCDYHSGVNGGGHHCFLDNNEERLKEYSKSLKLLLPNDFFAEFYKAYTAYIKDEKVEEACDLVDTYFYKNEKIIISILQRYANTL